MSFRLLIALSLTASLAHAGDGANLGSGSGGPVLPASGLNTALGAGSSGGGNGQASKFYSVAKTAINKLRIICEDDSSKPECQYLTPLLKALAQDEVTAEDVVLGPDGKPRDAINNGKDLVTVSRTRWDQTTSTPDNAERWVRTAVHEFASTVQLESSDTYAASNSIVNLLKDEGFDLTKIVGKLGFEVPSLTGLGINVEKTSQNSDNSVTFSGLSFTVGGNVYPINAIAHVLFGSMRSNVLAKALCKRIGMDAVTETDNVTGTQEYYQQVTMVTLDGDGRFYEVARADYVYLISITCRPQ